MTAAKPARAQVGVASPGGRRAALVLLFFFVLAVGLVRTQVDLSSRAFFGDGATRTQQLDAFQAVFGPDDELLIYLPERDRPEIAALVPRLLALEGVRAASYIPRPQSAPDLPALTLLGKESDAPPPLMIAVEGGSDRVLELRPRVLEIQTLVESTLGSQGDWGGLPATRVAFLELLVRDQFIFGNLLFLAFALGLRFVFGSWRDAGVLALVALAPTIALAGALGWMRQPIGLLNQSLFTLVPCLVLADALHPHVATRSAIEEGFGPAEAVRRAYDRCARPCAFALASSALGFAALGLADMPILRSYGAQASLGMGLAALSIFGLLPFALRRFPPSARFEKKAPSVPPSSLNRPVRVLLVGFTLLLLGLAGVPRLTIENRLSDLLNSDHPLQTTNQKLDRDYGGSLGLEIWVPPNISPPFDEAASLALELELASLSGVQSVVGPGQIELAQRLSFTGAPPLPLQFRGPEGQARIRVGVADEGSRAFALTRERVAEVLERNFEGGGPAVQLTGTADLAYAGVDAIAQDLRRSFSGLLAGIALALAWMLRRPKLILVALLINLFPLLIAYGAMGWLGARLDPIVGVVFILGLGIAVDDTAHLLLSRRRLIREGLHENQATRQAREECSPAIHASSGILVFGFVLQLGSSFPPLVALGALGALLIALAWWADLFFLPALLGSAPTPTTREETQSEQ